MQCRLGSFAALFLVFSSIGCSYSGSDKPKDAPKVIAPNMGPMYRKASCQFSVDQGSVADLRTVNQKQLVRAAFDKEFNQAHLEMIADTSINETLVVAKKLGVLVFKESALVSGSCGNYRNLAKPPKEIADRWQTAVRTLSGGLLALYLPQDANAPISTNKTNPVIVIREDNNRYTLVHELMHHFFYDRAKEDGIQDSELRSRLQKSTERYKQAVGAINASMGEAEMSEFSMASEELFESTDKMLLHFTLEEMAIEDYLRQMDQAYKLSHATEFDRLSGPQYVHGSAKKAREAYETFKLLAQDLKPIVSAKNAMVFDSILAKISARELEIYRVLAANPIPAFTGRVGLIAGSQQPAVAQPCAHTHAIDKELAETAEALNMPLNLK